MHGNPPTSAGSNDRVLPVDVADREKDGADATEIRVPEAALAQVDRETAGEAYDRRIERLRHIEDVVTAYRGETQEVECNGRVTNDQNTVLDGIRWQGLRGSGALKHGCGSTVAEQGIGQRTVLSLAPLDTMSKAVSGPWNEVDPATI